MFNKVDEFEKTISNFFGSPYAVATDSCTHAIEICLRFKNYNNISIPSHTYISIPFTLQKLNIDWKFKFSSWSHFYFLENTNIIDAAVLWKKDSYIENTFMCLSFQQKKHLPLGRGGMILLQNKSDYEILKKMSYDGRDLSSSKSWKDQDINTLGYHYYMTPETAVEGLLKFSKFKNKVPKIWSFADYPDLRNMSIFK